MPGRDTKHLEYSCLNNPDLLLNHLIAKYEEPTTMVQWIAAV